MIVVDSSALLAILFNEPEKQKFRDILSRGERPVVSAVNVHEMACVVRTRLGEHALDDLWHLLDVYEVEIVPIDAAQVRAAGRAAAVPVAGDPDLGRVLDDVARVQMRERDWDPAQEVPSAIAASEEIGRGAQARWTFC